jgi:hypothetical protein
MARRRPQFGNRLAIAGHSEGCASCDPSEQVTAVVPEFSEQQSSLILLSDHPVRR